MANVLLPLNTGAKIPALGFGTWQSPPGEVKKAVLHALKSGYKHIDCAYVYGNEAEVGEAFKEAFSSGICKREDIFITTKLWCTWHQRAEKGLDVSLERLGLDYVDLFLMHWPVPMNETRGTDFPKHADGSRDLMDPKTWSHTDTWKSMESLPSTGKTKAVGVSNYSVKFLKELLSVAKMTPAVNQIENHPYCPQQEIVDFCTEKGIVITAYSPFGSSDSPLMKEEPVMKVAQRRGISPGCVLLSYHVARNSAVLAKSVTPSRIEENKNIVDLSSEEMSELKGITEKHGITRFVFPPFGQSMGFPDKEKEAVAAA